MGYHSWTSKPPTKEYQDAHPGEFTEWAEKYCGTCGLLPAFCECSKRQAGGAAATPKRRSLPAISEKREELTKHSVCFECGMGFAHEEKVVYGKAIPRGKFLIADAVDALWHMACADKSEEGTSAKEAGMFAAIVKDW